MENTLYDKIELPSQGLYYTSKKKIIKIKPITTRLEMILTGINIHANNLICETILDELIEDKDILSELTTGDRKAILFYLYTTTYGFDYSISLKVGEAIEKYDLDLMDFEFNRPFVNIDDDGLPYIYTRDMEKIKFKVLNYKEKQAIRQYPNPDYLLVLNSIIDVNGITDQMQIKEYVDKLSIPKYRRLKKGILDCEPTYDTSFSIKMKNGQIFKGNMEIDDKFFGITPEYYDNLIKEIEILHERLKYSYYDIYSMTKIMRSKLLNSFIERLNKGK